MSDTKTMESAPTDREIFAYNAMYGWYRTKGYKLNGTSMWPLYGLLGAEGGVWYPVPSRWMEVPPTPEGADGPMANQLDSAEFHDKRYRAEHFPQPKSLFQQEMERRRALQAQREARPWLIRLLRGIG